MNAPNIVNAAAISAGYGLAVARAVGRNSAVLRAALADRRNELGEGIAPSDRRTLTDADLLSGTRQHTFLTDAGRTLAARL